MPPLTSCRTEHFSAAHRLPNPAWDDARNQLVVGKCSSPSYHGHHYNLTVHLANEPGAGTAQLDPTAEHVARVIWQHWRAGLPPVLPLGVTLRETDRNFAAYYGEES